MNKKITLALLVIVTAIFSYSFDTGTQTTRYTDNYFDKLNSLYAAESALLASIEQTDVTSEEQLARLAEKINQTRLLLKGVDFWARYLQPIDYRLLNGPLPVEWETEVFEKFEPPYKREGTGLTQLALYIEEEQIDKQHLIYLAKSAVEATKVFLADSTTSNLATDDHFFLCNRLFILNMGAIYTTGFECPDTSRIIPELKYMMAAVNVIYNTYNESFSKTPLPKDYLQLYNKAYDYVMAQPDDYSRFDHFTFIRDYVSPLFTRNQQLLNEYKVFSRSMVDYSLNKKVIPLFSKEIYRGQSETGLFHRVEDPVMIAEIEHIGKLLFYDPILSANNKRSCASCHKSTEFFTDTVAATSLHLNGNDFLPRNTPSLINAQYNHLLMMDGKHISMQAQAKDVITNHAEMGGNAEDIVKKVMSCNEYSKAFKKFLKHTPTETEVNLDHIASALTVYYTKFSKAYSPFDDAMNAKQPLTAEARQGFNLFMSKSQCATCHFVPQFNGVKPPFVGSEFEVLGVPADTAYKALSKDLGRDGIHKADEMVHAFRTGSIRNIEYTKPYMHNGVFRTLEEVVEFYNSGGGAGHGLDVPNQTLASDSLGLSATEKKHLISFMKSLNERIAFEPQPEKLPESKNKALNTRKVGGEY